MTLALALPQRARAQEQSADTAAARTFAVEGLKLADAGHCDQAIDKLSRAEKLHHSPIVLGKLGECLVAQGRVVEGSEALRRMLREPLPPNPTPALARAYERAQAALDAAKPQIAAVIITIHAPNGVEPVVSIDGQPVPPAVLGGERPTDPGEHVLDATAPGYLKATTKFSVGPGRKQTVELTLERDPDAPVAPPPGAPTTGTPGTTPSEAPPSGPTGAATATGQGELGAPPPSETPPNHTAAYVSWAVGGAALGVGTVFGILAVKGKSDLNDSCSNNVCPPDKQDKLDSAKRNGNIATVGLGVGAAGLVLGTVLYFTAGSGSTPAHDTSAHAGNKRKRSSSALRPSAAIGLGQVRLSLDF